MTTPRTRLFLAAIIVSAAVSACGDSQAFSPIDISPPTTPAPTTAAPTTAPHVETCQFTQSPYSITPLYVVPRDMPNRQLHLNGAIANSVTAMQAWLMARTGGSCLRIDRNDDAYRVQYAHLAKTDAEIAAAGPYARDVIEQELAQLGFNHPHKVYAVYYEGTSTHSCGGGAWPPVLIGHVAALYLRGEPPTGAPCHALSLAKAGEPAKYLELTMLHEILHTLGLVSTCAPNSLTGDRPIGHVSDDPRDLMYAGPAEWRPAILDSGNNDYYRHSQPGCPDLASSVFLDPLPSNSKPPPGWRAQQP
jgi:hypothetical protein